MIVFRRAWSCPDPQSADGRDGWCAAHFRKPLLLGALVALGATAVTWVIAQTVLGSLNRYGEKLAAIVSLVAIAMLLVILNWFYHRVYWNEHLAGLHGRKKRLVRAGIVGAATAQLIGLAALGFTSVYREGFETALFLQALVLEAGTGRVLLGVALGLAATVAVGFATIAFHRKLPHKKMLIATGGRSSGCSWSWSARLSNPANGRLASGHPGRRSPPAVWAGLRFGLLPTWQGLVAQAALSSSSSEATPC